MAEERLRIVVGAYFDGHDMQGPSTIEVRDGTIAEIRPIGASAGDDAPTFGHERAIALPGMLNGHHHSPRPSRLDRRDFPLELNLFQLRRRRLPGLSDEEEYNQTLLYALSMVRAGITSVIDSFPVDARKPDFGVGPSVQAYRDAGMKAALCLRVSDRSNYAYLDDDDFLSDVPADVAERSRAKTKAFEWPAFLQVFETIAREHDGRDGAIRIGFGPTGEQWCSDQLLSDLAAVAAGHAAPIQIHLLESPFQAEAAERRYGTSATRRLESLGVLGPRTSCAHGVWVDTDDVQRLHDTSSSVVHNPAANLWTADGIAPVREMLQVGIRVGLGLDGSGFEPVPDMLREMRLAMLLQRRTGWRREQLSPLDMLRMVTTGATAGLGLARDVGYLRPGAPADIVVIDADRLRATPYMADDPAELVAAAGSNDAIDLVVTDGVVRVVQGTPVGTDVAALTQRVEESLTRFRPLLNAADAELDELEPWLDAHFRATRAENHFLDEHGLAMNRYALGATTRTATEGGQG